MYTLNKICVFRADSTKIYIVNIICLHKMKALGLEKLSLYGTERWSWKMLVRDAECLDTKTRRKDRYFNWKFNISAIWKARSASTALQLTSVRSLLSWHAVSSTLNPSRKGDVVLTSSPQVWIHTKGPIGSTALVLHVISCSLEKKNLQPPSCVQTVHFEEQHRLSVRQPRVRGSAPHGETKCFNALPIQVDHM